MKQATIRDLELEEWLRQRDKGEIVWQTRSGEIIPIQKMSDTHLFNAIKKLSQYEEIEEIGVDMWDILGLDD
jgi:hypothetical protein